jgi:protein-S-isoprenylcysteine O-methyltransferase Ste14
MKPSGRITALALLVAAAVLGTSSMALLALFLLRGPLELVDFELGAPALYLWDALLCLLFFAQHSIMIRPSFQQRWLRLVPEHAQGALYTIASGVALFVVVLLWQESDRLLVAHSDAIVALVVVAWVLGGGIMLWGILALRADVLGLEPIVAHLRERRLPVMGFTVRGPYRLVRHPLYLGALLMIWASPQVSADRLLFNLLWSAWVVVGTLLEERDLVATFGDAYRRYQQEVPMLVPRARRPAGSD